MNDDKKKNKFFLFLNYFSYSMIFFVLSKSLFSLVITWELLGLTSFFLITHYENNKSLKSGISAFLMNRLSDLFITLIVLIIIIYDNDQFIIENNKLNSNINIFFAISLVIASFIKSAQFVFFKWLPDSMEAPLPASALIHSATLVSAGIFLLIKYNFFFKNIYLISIFLIISITSAVFFSLISAFQTDVKKALAYSTIANCSFIYSLIFSKNFDNAIIYFSIHGFFKSLVFIIFGYAIIVYKHKQDIRNWNNIFNHNNKIILLVIIPIICLGALQISPVYFFKSQFNYNYIDNKVLYYFYFIMV